MLGCDRAGYVVRLRDEEPADFADAYRALVDRRCRREPVAYILGEREFWGLPFEVTPDVLIPRPETELIVEEALELFPAGRAPGVIVDVGTGSGCLAVALALEFAEARVIATDISEAALGGRAAQRRRRNGVADRIDFRAGDLLEPVTETADLIVSNPPVRRLGRRGRHSSPRSASTSRTSRSSAGTDGLSMFARLFPSAAPRLAPGGRLIVEVGYDQDDRGRGASRHATAGR